MNNTFKSILSIIAVVSVTSAAFAAKENTSEPIHDLPTYKVEDVTLPVLRKAKAPPVTSLLNGAEIEIIFRISAKGTTHGVSQKRWYSDPKLNDFAAAMKRNIRKWEFEPAKDNDGNPVAVKVALPVKVGRKVQDGKSYVSIGLGNFDLISRAN